MQQLMPQKSCRSTEKQNKARILYVDRDPSTMPYGYDTQLYIYEKLKKKYAVRMYCYLNYGVPELIKKSLKEKKFDAVITHMPPNDAQYFHGYFSDFINAERGYKRSLSIVQKIKEISDIPVVLYTSAGGGPAMISVFRSVGDTVISRTMYPDRDLAKIEKTVSNLLKRYQTRPQSVDNPQLQTENGHTVVRVRVNLNGGLDMNSVVKILKIGKGYDKGIFFERVNKKDFEDQICDGKSFFSMIASQMFFEGENLKIHVEGTESEALKIARSLYAVLNARYWFTVQQG